MKSTIVPYEPPARISRSRGFDVNCSSVTYRVAYDFESAADAFAEACDLYRDMEELTPEVFQVGLDGVRGLEHLRQMAGSLKRQHLSLRADKKIRDFAHLRELNLLIAEPGISFSEIRFGSYDGPVCASFEKEHVELVLYSPGPQRFALLEELLITAQPGQVEAVAECLQQLRDLRTKSGSTFGGDPIPLQLQRLKFAVRGKDTEGATHFEFPKRLSSTVYQFLAGREDVDMGRCELQLFGEWDSAERVGEALGDAVFECDSAGSYGREQVESLIAILQPDDELTIGFPAPSFGYRYYSDSEFVLTLRGETHQILIDVSWHLEERDLVAKQIEEKTGYSLEVEPDE